jgi:magnesium transporter
VIRTLYFDDSGAFHGGIALDDVSTVVASRRGLVWVDLSEESADGRELLSRTFHVHPLAIDDCFNLRVDIPKVDDYGDYLFIITQSVDYLADRASIEIAELDVFLGPNYVVTCHLRRLSELDQLWDRACQNVHLMNRGADMLAHSVLDAVIDRTLPEVEEIDDHIDTIEVQMLENPDQRLLPQLMQVRRHIMQLRRSMLPQRDVINRMSRGEFPRLIRPESQIYFRDVYDHTVRIEEILESVRDVADSAVGIFLSSVNNRMNEVMKTMAVVAAIFLPLTLLASIFGTNLNYSSVGVRFEHGFLLMLVSMLVLAAVMVAYFRKRGWF